MGLRKNTVAKGIAYLLMFGGLYYVWTFIGFVTGVIRYGGPANQAFGLVMATVSLLLVLVLSKKLR